MAQGLKLPLTTDKGRLVKLSGDGYINQLVFAALLGRDSDNPFQDIGLGEFMIFDINDGMTEGEIRARIVAVFEALERDQLAKLEDPDEDLIMNREDDTGKLFAELTYVNMETQERVETEVPIPPAGE